MRQNDNNPFVAQEIDNIVEAKSDNICEKYYL